jgi:CubicO group peptidase (beta-lactamase class C family)
MMARRAVLGTLVSAPLSLLLPRMIRASGSGLGHVQALLQDYVAKHRIAGAVAVIGTKDGPQWTCAGRLALGDRAAPCEPDSLWRIYSMTKLVTGAAAMQLLEQGKLTLDTPVSEFFPTFGASQVLIEPGKPETRSARTPVTVRHLMTHTAGFVGSLVPEPPLGELYRERRLNVNWYSIDEESRARHQPSLLAFAQAAGTVPLAFEPGTQWSYGISTDVLGAVLEKVSGIAFEELLKERIFGPLGMADTGFVVSTRALGRLATNYEVTPEGLRAVDAPPQTLFARAPPFPFPASGLVSSAHDFARFAGMLLNEGRLGRTRVLATPTAQLMMSNLLPEGVRASYGLGWGGGGAVFLSSIPGPTPLGMTAGTYGWSGACGTVCWVDRTSGIYAILMAQYTPTESSNLLGDFTGAILRDGRLGAGGASRSRT